MSDDQSDHPLEANVAIALVSGVLYQLQRRNILPPEDVTEVFDTALAVLEGMEVNDRTASLRQMLERALSHVAAQGNGRTGQ